MQLRYRTIRFLTLPGLLIQLLMYSCSPKLSLSGNAAGNDHGDRKKGFGIVSDLSTEPKILEMPELKNDPGRFRAPTERSPRSSILADDLLETAKTYLGVPHCMGGTSFRCIDCSGFVMKVFEEYGISLPHNAQAQSRIGEIVSNRSELIKGDIVFFKESYLTSNYITHSGIYIGDNRFIHTSSGKGVTITSLEDPWWKDKFVHGTRVLQ